MKQKVLTPEQYAALGYVQRPDFDPQMFDVKPDKPLSEPFIDIAYRSETKEEYYIDASIFIFKVGYTLGTSGAIPAASFAIREILRLTS